MMAHQESITGTSLRTPPAAAAAGIVFSLLFSLALVLLLLSAPSDTATEGVWLTDTSHRATMAVALNLVPFGGIAFLWFIGVVRDRIGPREDRFFATVFLGSGLLFVAMLFVGAAVDGGLIANMAARSAVPGPDTLAISRPITHLALHVYALRVPESGVGRVDQVEVGALPVPYLPRGFVQVRPSGLRFSRRGGTGRIGRTDDRIFRAPGPRGGADRPAQRAPRA